jgi:hypothetical protein
MHTNQVYDWLREIGRDRRKGTAEVLKRERREERKTNKLRMRKEETKKGRITASVL